MIDPPLTGERRRRFGYLLIGAGTVSMAVFLVLAVLFRADPVVGPVMLGVVLMELVQVVVGFWLLRQADRQTP